MARYLLGRLLQAIVILWVISVLAFLLTRLIPGDPARIILGTQHVTAANLAVLRHELGLDRPLLTQYLRFLGGAVHFDFGDSISLRQPVSSVLGPRIWASLWLVGYSCLIAVIVIVPLGLIAAVRRNRLADHVIRLGSTLGYATPAFLSGLLLILIFSLKLGLFPVEGYGSGFVGHLRSLTLPAITVAFSAAPPLLRTLRSGLLDTLSQDFVEAARARGLSGRRVLWKHALRNSLLPTLTVLGLSIGTLLSWTLIVENVFSIPGLGSLLVTSVMNRDYPVVQALVIVFAGAVVLSSLMTDLLYVVVDPRIRL
jgi:peptide/nickel transport system permease protein